MARTGHSPIQTDESHQADEEIYTGVSEGIWGGREIRHKTGDTRHETMEIDMNKIKFLKEKTRCEIYNIPPSVGSFIYVCVYFDQNPRGILKEKIKVLKPYFFIHYFGWSKTPEDGDVGRIFGQDRLKEAVDYAKERILEAKKKPIPKDLLNKIWYSVYDFETRKRINFQNLCDAYVFHQKTYFPKPTQTV